MKKFTFKGDIMKTKQIIQAKLEAELSQITHQSLNSTFVGNSKKFQQPIFVKVFPQKNKFITEKAVNQQLYPHRVLTSFTITGPQQLFVLVMKDLAPVDLKLPITTQLAYVMGTKLAEFHQKVKPFVDIYPNNNLFAKAEHDIAQLQESTIKTRLQLLLQDLSSLQPAIESDLLNYSTTVLHGDVGVRNYKIINGQPNLIDFERARMGVNYQDFIKLFYQDFGLNKELITSFINGYKSSGETVMASPSTQVFLLLLTAIGIMSYTSKISDPPFQRIGEKMLDTVELFLKVMNSAINNNLPINERSSSVPELVALISKD